MLRNHRHICTSGALLAFTCFISIGLAGDDDSSSGRARLHDLEEEPAAASFAAGTAPTSPSTPQRIAGGPFLAPQPLTQAPLSQAPLTQAEPTYESPVAPLTVPDGDSAAVPLDDGAMPPPTFPDLPETPPFESAPAFHGCPGPQCGSPYAPFVPYNPSVPEAEPTPVYHLAEGFLEALTKPVEPMAEFFGVVTHAEHDHPKTELDCHPIGLQPIPPRPRLVLELNDEFLSPGFLNQGICLPTGAVWRPSLWVFGLFRTGVNYFDNGAADPVAEWANRLDLFAQLNLSGTERILFGLRPLDEQVGGRRDFTGYDFRNGGSLDAWNADIQTLFFEGDFGEIFPNLDPYDTRALDYGFSIGRQPMLFQQGLLMNEDRIDAFTVTRNTLNGYGNLNLRATGVYAFNSINRNNLAGNNIDDHEGQMIGLFTESDFRIRTINADVAYVWSDDGFGDLMVIGLSSIRRFHGFHNTYNSSFHFLASFPTNGETNFAGQGELLFSQLSWTPHHTEDLIYLSTFWAIDEFTSASRGPLAGGPLGQTGLLFSAAGLGRYGAPLNNQANNVVGGSLGYQMFFDHTKQQVVFEVGGRQDTNDVDEGGIGTAVRFQRALNQHWLVIVDGFVTKRESNNLGQGGRVEFQMKF